MMDQEEERRDEGDPLPEVGSDPQSQPEEGEKKQVVSPDKDKVREADKKRRESEPDDPR